ncbi:MAG: ATP-dependent helicase [Clostridium sp.]|nr:ATP-dependent helicase [Clostridium sp.]
MEIKSLIQLEHEGDQAQMDAVVSDYHRILLEAPAGCGKTKTMVSKVAYVLASEIVPANKKILALTFSVNAAYKMKKDISEKLPQMGIDDICSPATLNSKISITNYHGFARRVLRLYGYLLYSSISDVNMFVAYNEENIGEIEAAGIELNDEEQALLHFFSEAVKKCNSEKIETLFQRYYEVIIGKFIPKSCITYNGYLVLCIKLLEDEQKLRAFYQLLYPYIMIDEFQDTNYLSWKLIKLLISQNTKLFFMGDPLQRIYGFIGAIPNLLEIAKTEFSMTKIQLDKNYRFRNNQNMLLLDKNIRRNAENYLEPFIKENAKVKLTLHDTQEQEAINTSKLVRRLLESKEDKVAILIQQRNPNAEIIMKQLENDLIDYFYGLFSDDDLEYIQFHQKALKILFTVLEQSRSKRVNKSLLSKVCAALRQNYKDSSSKVIQSLLILTEAFFNKLLTEYLFLENEEKIAYINDTFENRALKQSMDYVNSRVFVSTVHGSKGLEWDYVILPDMEPYLFPNFGSLCGNCDFRTGRINAGDYCRIQVENHVEKEVLEELSVFYVAVTRAQKDVFFSASKKRYNSSGEIKNSKISCLLTILGIEIL